MICNLLMKAQKGEQKAMMELIDRFQPLLRKYAKKLGYDDAYEDCLLFFIELITTMNLRKINGWKDQSVVSYIKVSVINFYKRKIRKVIKEEQEIVFSELTKEQRYYIEARMAKPDEINDFLELGIDRFLSKEEWMILYLVYAKGYTIAEIARKEHKSRQTVNQLKQRTLNKLKKWSVCEKEKEVSC